MGLQDQITASMKEAMKSKDRDKLEALRAIKSEILKFNTSGSGGELTEADEIKMLQKLVKQRKEAAELYDQQGREDLSSVEKMQAAVITEFLPEQMSEDDLRKVLADIISKVGAAGPSDMGKVMGTASKELAGKADGKTISSIVKEMLA